MANLRCLLVCTFGNFLASALVAANTVKKLDLSNENECYEGDFSYLMFQRFIIFTFRNYFTLCKIVFAKLCYAFKGKLFFSATVVLCKKVILSCLTMNLKISNKLR